MADKKHNHSHHFFLALVLFVLDSILFGGYGRITALLSVLMGTRDVFANAAVGNFDSSLLEGEVLLFVTIAIIVNIVVYYILAGVLIFLFNLVSRNR